MSACSEQTTAHTADCGTPGAEAGAFFGLNGDTVLLSGATNVSNASAAEFNVECQAGSSVKHKTGIQIAVKPLDAVHGSTTDAAIVISSQGGVGFNTGILFSDMSGFNPLTSSGTAMKFSGPGVTIATGIDLSGMDRDQQSAFKVLTGGAGLSNSQLWLAGARVVVARQPGWAPITNGTPARGAFNVGAATTASCAQAIAALITDLMEPMA